MTEQEVRMWCAERDLVVTSKKFWEVAADAIRVTTEYLRQCKVGGER